MEISLDGYGGTPQGAETDRNEFCQAGAFDLQALRNISPI